MDSKCKSTDMLPGDLRIVQITDDILLEFGVEMWGDAGFETGFLTFVVAFHDLGGLMEARNDGGIVVGNFQLHEFANRSKAGAEFSQEFGKALAGFGGDGHGVRIEFAV